MSRKKKPNQETKRIKHTPTQHYNKCFVIMKVDRKKKNKRKTQVQITKKPISFHRPTEKMSMNR